MSSHLRVIAPSYAGHEARVLHIADDGTETDISDVLQGVEMTITLGVGELNTVTLKAIKVVTGDLHATVSEDSDSVLHDLQPENIPAE